ncbi:NADP-dependent oxidoreductase [Phytohabitans houttuyneae]|uniref:NADPH:quinone reductase n=1 Tax=Phytohabitans houttuyneae TaxID=1076126 RepID=A0A6V8KC96_9ACTN|nr:NADP-dependent oxidoreductase [Phytohabitans houttuyneae]GFJ82813.1 NADPH:quinone reductase [Phytohabitans houttuyneae]
MRIHGYGEASAIRADEVPRPAPGPGEVLLKVAATSFNPSDVGWRRGLLRHVAELDLPWTLGGEVAGTVVAAGPGRVAFAPGDRVVGRVDAGGAAAEYMTAPAADLVAAPAAIPLAHAAALPIAGLTAWQAVFAHARVAPGQRVLVNGAGGGVGRFAVQLAKHAGAYVVATAGPRSAAAVRQLGADRVLDYTSGPLTLDEPVDTLLHLVPGPASGAAALVRPGGAAVSVTGPAGVGARHFVVRNDTADLAALVALVDAGAVRVDVTVRPLADLADVHREAEAGTLRGKTVLVP